MADGQTSPGNAHPPSRLCLPYIHGKTPGKYWTLKIIAFSSSLHASYGSCPSGQRFAFAFLQIPPRDGHPWRSATGSPYRAQTGLGNVLPHPLVSAPCRAHNKKPPLSRRLWGEKDLNLRRRKPTDLQSAPFDHSGISPMMDKSPSSHLPESNRGPRDYKSRALPTELRWRGQRSAIYTKATTFVKAFQCLTSLPECKFGASNTDVPLSAVSCRALG